MDLFYALLIPILCVEVLVLVRLVVPEKQRKIVLWLVTPLTFVVSLVVGVLTLLLLLILSLLLAIIAAIFFFTSYTRDEKISFYEAKEKVAVVARFVEEPRGKPGTVNDQSAAAAE